MKFWRASGRNSSIIPNPTVAQVKNRHKYAKDCDKYVSFMCSEIIRSEEQRNEGNLLLRGSDYYKNRYETTHIETTIIRDRIYQKLNQ